VNNNINKSLVSVLLVASILFFMTFSENNLYGNEPEGYVVGFFNGINAEYTDAILNLIEIGKLMKSERIVQEDGAGRLFYNGETVKYELFYNQTVASGHDMLETFIQRAVEMLSRYGIDVDIENHLDILWGIMNQDIEQMGLLPAIGMAKEGLLDLLIERNVAHLENVYQNMYADYTRHEVLLDAHIRQGKKLLLIAHSQGNLYVNHAYEYIFNNWNYEYICPDSPTSNNPCQSAKVIHVAPASRTLYGPYVLDKKDQVIIYFESAPAGNVDVDGWTGFGIIPLYHDFINVYLKKDKEGYRAIKDHITDAMRTLVSPRIYVPVTGVTLNKNATSLTFGSSETLIAAVLPENATNKNVTWSSSNSGVAVVNSVGVVTAVASSGTATITVRTADSGYTATCIVNVGDEGARRITVGETITDQLGYEEDGTTDNEDWYYIDITADGLLDIEFTKDSTLSARVQIYASDGFTSLAYLDFSGGALGGNCATAVQPGRYFIRIGRWTYGGYGGYSMTVSHTLPAVANDTEPNNTTHEATQISTGVRTGHLGYSAAVDGTTDTEDWYYIDITADGLLNIEFTKDSTLSARVQIFASDGFTSLAYLDFSGGALGGNCAAAVQPGRYFIRIGRWTYGGYGGYSMTVSHTLPAVANDTEPNNTTHEATQISTGVRTGHLGYSAAADGTTDMEDWYYIDITRSGQLNIAFTKDSTLSTRVQIYASDGFTSLAYRDFSGGALGGNCTVDVQPGRYYIRIGRWTYGGYGGYSMTVSSQ